MARQSSSLYYSTRRRAAAWRDDDPGVLNSLVWFAEAVHAKYPGKLLAYNCSPSFNWKAKLDDATIAKFQRELGAMGYKFQFVTLAGFHSLNLSMFDLADGYRDRGMAAYSEMQQREFAATERGFTAVRHQREVVVRRGTRPGRQVLRDPVLHV